MMRHKDIRLTFPIAATVAAAVGTAVVTVLLTAGLASCSGIGNGIEDCNDGLVRVVLSTGSQPMVSSDVMGTRAGSDYIPKGERFDGFEEADVFPANTKAGVVFSRQGADTPSPDVWELTSVSDYTGFFTFAGNGASSKWISGVRVERNSQYMVFGHVPYDCCRTAQYNFTAGTIQLNNVSPVSDTDVSLIAGVGSDHYWKDGKTGPNMKDDRITGAFPCNFAYETFNTDSCVLCVLLDHLFVRMGFSFSIGDKYNELRDIKIKTISLSAPQMKAVNAAITLDTENNSHTKTTAIKDIVWSYDAAAGGYGNEKVEIFSSANGIMLTPDSQTFGYGYFIPNVISDAGGTVPLKYQIEVEYIVLDKKGNVLGTRTATNALRLYNDATLAGHSYNTYITVEPTYLNRLSEGDLDNPGLSLQ